MSNSNPLLSPQREKSGSETITKYHFQYHWALERALEEHEKQGEYAVFVELHEDVVFSNSLNGELAEFEFNQIKNVQRAFTIKDLTRAEAGKLSVLAKLIQSCVNKDYSSQIKEMNLVSTKGFNVGLKNKELKLNIIKTDDLDLSTFDALENALKTEDICTKLPNNLQFIITNLPAENFQDNIVGKISSLICKLYPDANYNSVNIYRALIDELYKKGGNTIDYRGWAELLKKKALTSTTVKAVIQEFVKSKDQDNINKNFDEICSDLRLGYLQKAKIKIEFNRYNQRRIGTKSTLQLETTSKIRSLIKDNEDNPGIEMRQLIDIISAELPLRILEQFTNSAHLEGAILCEFITRD